MPHAMTHLVWYLRHPLMYSDRLALRMYSRPLRNLTMPIHAEPPGRATAQSDGLAPHGLRGEFRPSQLQQQALTRS